MEEKVMTKKDIIRLLEDIAIYLELNLENGFRVSAYRKAAAALERDQRSFSEIESFSDIKRNRKKTREVIEEYIETGVNKHLNELKKETHDRLTYIKKIPGIGEKRVAKIYESTGISTLDELEKFIRDGKFQKFPGFGKK